MKNTLVFLFILIFTFPKNLNSQNEDVAAAVATGLFAIGAGVAAIEQLKEQAELAATEWLLGNNEDFSHFALSTSSFNEVKASDLSNLSVTSFEVQEYDPATIEIGMVKNLNSNNSNFNSSKGTRGKLPSGRVKGYLPNGEKFILLRFSDPNWINEYGIDYDKLSYFLIDYEKWLDIMVTYASIASNNYQYKFLRDEISEGKIIYNGIKNGKETTVKFRRLRGDMYAVADFDDKMKIVYNERGMGIYLKKTQRLVQIKRRAIVRLNNFIKP